MTLVVVSDIDECTNETHSCDVNAVCNNTCKDGFYRDGINCTGSYLHNAVGELNSGLPRKNPNNCRVKNLKRTA